MRPSEIFGEILSELLVNDSAIGVMYITLFELFERNRLFPRVANPAKYGIRNDDRLVNIVLAAINAQDERGCFDMVFTDGPAAKTAGGMGGTVTVNAIHLDTSDG